MKLLYLICLSLTVSAGYGQCPSFTVSPSSATTCNGSSPVFTASGGTNYRWYKDAPLVPGNLLQTGNSTFSPTTTGPYFLVGNACSTADLIRPFSAVVSNTPGTPSILSRDIPYGTSAIMKPSTILESNESFKWYASNQTTLLSQGAEFYTGNLIASSTTYYVSRTNNYCESPKAVFFVTTNSLPTVNAVDGTVQLPAGSATVIGSGTDSGGGFLWSKVSGPSVTMSGETTTTLTLTNITAGTYVFRLSVTDAIGQKVVDDAVFQALPASPTNNYNYIKQETILIRGVTNPTQAATLPVTQKSSTTNYLDELGRPMENVEWQGSPGKFDIIGPVVYDILGRSSKRYLPTVSSAQGNGLYKKVLDANGEYSGSEIQPIYTDKPYAVTKFENNPLSRTVEQGSVGQSWQPGSTSGTTKLVNGTNAANEVRLWSINTGTVPTGLPQSTGTWTINTLASSTATTDISDTNTKETVIQFFKDAQGLKRVERTKLDATNWAETHYVYDGRNNLRFTIPPQLYKDLKTANNYAPTLDQVNRYCFQYEYDDRHRLVGKKDPGADWQYFVYDIRDRVVLSQDGNQRLKNEWTYFEYDNFDRITVTGIYRPLSSNYTRTYFQSVYDGTVSLPPTTSTVLTGTNIVSANRGNYLEYIASNSITLQPGFAVTASASVTFKASIYSLLQPGQVLSSGSTEPLEYTYYDSYTGNAFFQDPNFAFATQSWEDATGADTNNKFDRVLGQVTGRSVKILGTTQWLNSVVYYDQSQRPIQTVSSLHVGGLGRSSTLYDFRGKALETKQIQLGQTIVRQFKYDHAGRVVKVFHKLNSQPKVILSAFEYDELGQVKDKKLYSTDIASATPTYFQSIDYGYNIKGWLTKANSASGSDVGETDYFGYEMGYETDAFGASISSTLRKDGMATALKWKNDFSGRQNLYVYDYDNLNRLSSALFKAGTNSAWTSKPDYYSEKGLGYDYNGNIQTLQRNKQAGVTLQLIDNLGYNYGTSGGNQLMKVTESSSAALKDLGFKDGNTVGDDYGYDVNGNLIVDKNKGITDIMYNFLNLPERVTFSDGTYMQYTYDAGGSKLTQTYFDSGGQSQLKTDYIGEQLLVNDLPVVIFHEEGRLLPPDNSNGILNREANGMEGYTGNLSVTLSSVSQNGQTYVKVVSNQATSNPGVFIATLPSYTVKPGEKYQFKVLGYRETAQNAKLYVKHASGDIIWSTGTLLPQGLSNETWSTNEFTVPAGVTQITLGVRWDNPSNNAVNGATMYINQVALYKMDWEYQYFLKDQVGSPRVVLSTNPSTQKYTATFEMENQATESGPNGFFNIDPTKISIHTSNVTPGGNEVIWLDKNYPVGPSRSLRVYPGDQVDASVSAYYVTMSGLSPATTAAMSSALIEVMTTAGLTTFDGGITNAYNMSGGSGAFTLSPDNGGSKPSAFLNYILFDENYVPLEAKSVSIGNANTVHMLSFSATFGSPIAIKEVGYMFVYLSYDNNQTTPVYFDDFKITHTESPMVQVNDNYPFGLTSYSWIREGEYENRFLYQGKELDAKTGLHDFHARQYDATLGRWFVMDPAGQFSSPYNGMGNNPVMGTDPDGKFFWFAPIIGAVIGAVSGAIHASNDPNMSTGGGIWRGALIGGLAGLGGAGISAAGGGAMLAGAGGGAIAGAGFSGMATGWDAQAMVRGGLIGAASGFVGGGFASAIGGGMGAAFGGVASDLTSQLLSTGDVDLLRAGVAGVTSFGMYHGMSYASYKLGGGNHTFAGKRLTYRQFAKINTIYQRSRFWHREHGVYLNDDGSARFVHRKDRDMFGVGFPDHKPSDFGTVHTHWAKPNSEWIDLDGDGYGKMERYHSSRKYGPLALRFNAQDHHHSPGDFGFPGKTVFSMVVGRHGGSYFVPGMMVNGATGSTGIGPDPFVRFFMFPWWLE